MNWDQVTSYASQYTPYLNSRWPSYISEMTGVAEGAGVDFLSILALNVRTEIAFGSFADGCTALSYHKGNTGILAQNWDWNKAQIPNLINLNIDLGATRISMITEAGIIGKIGLNSNGVGCTLNALKAAGTDFGKLPCHLALRTVLEGVSRDSVVEILEKEGVASAGHILVAEKDGAVGLECSSEGIQQVVQEGGVVTHTNHYILPFPAGSKLVESPYWLPDTVYRLGRVRELISKVDGGLSKESVQEILMDEVEGDGAAICRRTPEGKEGSDTLFSIVMELKGKPTASVKVGRPTEPSGSLVLSP